MPRKRSRRSNRGDVIALAAVALLALALGWWLLSPRPSTPPKTVAAVTPEPTPRETPTAVPTAAAAATATPSAVASPTPAAPALPVPTKRPAAGAPRLALIVDDCGQWIETERGFIALGIPLTMSVLPDVHYTTTIAAEAANAGKGVMLHLPMETVSGLNPGPGKVTTEMSDAQIADQVENDLAQVPLARGVNNHEGSKASADARVMRDVIGVLAKRGDLFFIDSRTSAKSVAESTAAAAGVPTAGRDVFLDNEETVAYTEAQLRQAASIARETGSAIAIGHPRATTLDAVKAMIPDLQASGIEFVLASDLVSTDAK